MFLIILNLNVLLAVCEGGTVFHPSILDITDEDMLNKFAEVGVKCHAHNFSLFSQL